MSSTMRGLQSADAVWLDQLMKVMHIGQPISPRGMETKEIRHSTVAIEAQHPVVTIQPRKLSYRFMAAEAYWILSGDDRVSTIAPWNTAIAQFSDDGERFFGAYGPKIVGQLPYVVGKLIDDPDSRQAGLTIWRENPTESKDIPCTVSIFFQIRDGYLVTHVFMRSSDVWLGLPYDLFNFSMLAHLVCCRFNTDLCSSLYTIEPGMLYLTAASSHLYGHNFEAARMLISTTLSFNRMHGTPEELWRNETDLMERLKTIRDSKRGDACRWWEEQ